MNSDPKVARRLCVFCGARAGDQPHWQSQARAFGVAMVQRGWQLVYGGGRVGLMGALADGVIEAGGDVLGVIPRSLVAREQAHPGASTMEVVVDMAERKTRMIALADAFAVLPGGFGTLDELFEVLTLRQLGEHAKPTVVLDDRGYWQPLMALLAQMVSHGFAAAADMRQLAIASDVQQAFDLLETGRPLLA